MARWRAARRVPSTSITIKSLTHAIPQSTWSGESGCSLKEIRLKLRAECLHRFLIQSGEKAGQGGTRGEVLAIKQCQKLLHKRSKTIIKGRNRWFPTESIAEKHNHEIDRVVRSKASTGKLHLVFDGRDYPGLGENVSHCRDFFHP